MARNRDSTCRPQQVLAGICWEISTPLEASWVDSGGLGFSVFIKLFSRFGRAAKVLSAYPTRQKILGLARGVRGSKVSTRFLPGVLPRGQGLGQPGTSGAADLSPRPRGLRRRGCLAQRPPRLALFPSLGTDGGKRWWALCRAGPQGLGWRGAGSPSSPPTQGTDRCGPGGSSRQWGAEMVTGPHSRRHIRTHTHARAGAHTHALASVLSERGSRRGKNSPPGL